MTALLFSIFMTTAAYAEHFAKLDFSRAQHCEIYNAGYNIQCVDEHGNRVVDARLLEKDGWIDYRSNGQLEVMAFMGRNGFRAVRLSEGPSFYSDFYSRGVCK